MSLGEWMIGIIMMFSKAVHYQNQQLDKERFGDSGEKKDGV